MRVRSRFILVMALSVASLVSTLSVAVWTISEYREINTTTRHGLQLISDASGVHVLMKDMLVGVFTPQTYGVLKDLVHLEQFSATRRTWESAADEFFRDYNGFLSQERLIRMVNADAQLREEYAVARRLLGRTQEMVASLEQRLDQLEARGILGREDTYYLIQRAADPEVVPVFNEIRETSFYLTNTFESFLHHFVSSLEDQAVLLQRRLIGGMSVFVLLISAGTLIGTWLLSRTIVSNVHAVARAMESLSRGDFTASPAIRSHDEFGELSANFEGFLVDLRQNVNVVLDLQHRLQRLAGHERPVQEVYPLVCETVRTGIGADTVAITETAPGGTDGGVRASVGDPMPVDRTRSVWAEHLLEAPMDAEGQTLILYRRSAPFTELERTIVNSYAEFARLLIENHVRYAEILERRNAQYEALQAQIRPHFLYNVLNNIIGLNRMQDRSRLEEAVVALKEILRYSLGSERMTTLGDEIRIARRYCSLQELRFDDRITFDLNCPPEYDALPMPKLILQPLVENAIIHGLEPKATPGHLSIRVEPAAVPVGTTGRAVDIVVEDDGVGFAGSADDGGTQIGLRNVEQRLQVTWQDARLLLEDRPAGGARCIIRVPARVVEAACAS